MSNPEEGNTRRKNALIVASVQLATAIVGFALAVRAYEFTTNLRAGAFWAHAVVGFGACFTLLYLCGKNHGKVFLLFGMVFTVLGCIMTSIGVIVDAVYASFASATDFSRCFFSAEGGTVHECVNGDNPVAVLAQDCSLEYKPWSCSCCYIQEYQKCNHYTRTSFTSTPVSYEGVRNCWEVENVYTYLLWTSAVLGVMNFILSVASSALVGHFKGGSTEVRPLRRPRRRSSVVTTSHSNVTMISNQGPIFFYPQEEAVGYYPSRLHVSPIQPPDYETVIRLQAPSVQPRRPARDTGETGAAAPKNSCYDSMPPPYEP